MLEYLGVAQRICLYLARTSPQQTIDHLVYELSLQLLEEEPPPGAGGPAGGGGGGSLAATRLLGVQQAQAQQQGRPPLQFADVLLPDAAGERGCVLCVCASMLVRAYMGLLCTFQHSAPLLLLRACAQRSRPAAAHPAAPGCCSSSRTSAGGAGRAAALIRQQRLVGHRQHRHRPAWQHPRVNNRCALWWWQGCVLLLLVVAASCCCCGMLLLPLLTLLLPHCPPCCRRPAQRRGRLAQRLCGRRGLAAVVVVSASIWHSSKCPRQPWPGQLSGQPGCLVAAVCL